MKKTMSVAMAVMAGMLLAAPSMASEMKGCDTVKAAGAGEKCVSGKTVYTCPMHPEVVSEKPGKCPKCGMFLAKKTASQGPVYSKKVAGYSCPMHSEAKDDKNGKCPKCGMKLEKACQK